MGRRSHQIKTDNLGSLLAYMLGHRPAEFGLLPDGEGFVSYKELIQAIHEETGWQYIRRSHLNEVLLGKNRHFFQPEDRRIKALKREWQLDLENPAKSLPKVLLTAVRRRAHAVVMEKGLKSAEGRYNILTLDQDFALRLGRRRDQKPVLLEINAAMAESEGVLFYSFDNLFLCRHIPARFISGPPVAKKEDLSICREKKTVKETAGEKLSNLHSGTFLLDSSRDPDALRRDKRKKRKGWKEERRRDRRHSDLDEKF